MATRELKDRLPVAVITLERQAVIFTKMMVYARSFEDTGRNIIKS